MYAWVYGTPGVSLGQVQRSLEATSFISSVRPTGTDYCPSILIKT